jgi:hypothetical protein
MTSVSCLTSPVTFEYFTYNVVTCKVPIYDGQKTQVGFHELLVNLEQLPRATQEIPCDSCAVVAYTISTWGPKSAVNVSFNVKWVMALGILTIRK